VQIDIPSVRKTKDCQNSTFRAFVVKLVGAQQNCCTVWLSA